MDGVEKVHGVDSEEGDDPGLNPGARIYLTQCTLFTRVLLNEDYSDKSG